MEEKRLTKKHEWRELFTSKTIKEAEELFNYGNVSQFACDQLRAEAVVKEGRSLLRVQIKQAPYAYSAGWNAKYFNCSCSSGLYYRMTKTTTCKHVAATLMYWENKKGPWIFTENDQEYNFRIKCEAEEAEKERLRKIKEDLEKQTLGVKKFLDERTGKPGNTFFDIKLAVLPFDTNMYEVNGADKILEDKNSILMDDPALRFGPTGKRVLCAEAYIKDPYNDCSSKVEMIFSRTGIEECWCNCRRYYYGVFNRTESLCRHKLALIKKVYDYVEKNDPGDATDLAASEFFSAMDLFGQNNIGEEKEQIRKEESIVISPLLTIDNGSVALSFKVGLNGQKQFQLKKIEQFSAAVQAEETFELGKSSVLDFSKQDFTESSKPWLNFIHQKVSDTEKINNRLGSRSSWYYYTPSIKTQNKDELYGATLDRFYDIAEGTDCECARKNAPKPGERRKPGRRTASGEVLEPKEYVKSGSMIHIGHHNMKVSIATEPIKSANGGFLGISVKGKMPIIRSGSVDGYIIGDDYISRISKDEQAALIPFMKASDKDGNISFNIGKDMLSEFYYRVVPVISEQPYVEFIDGCADMAAELMPPEPQFTFIFDQTENFFVCREKVKYEEDEITLPRTEKSLGRYDEAQEKRVTEAVKEFFPFYDDKSGRFLVKADEDTLFKLLNSGVSKLSQYGHVFGTDAFKINRIKPIPQVSVGVSVESGIMDISVTSKDASPEELLAILESYRLKKRYYRLKSGEYVDLSPDEQLNSLTEVADGMNISLETMLKEGVKVPAYRALYLNKLLEEREALLSNRDKTYRALIKNFQTIKDADYEEPEGFKDVLRPYQTYGFKWLKTLSAAGFGGILADEMGLGKTLQAISLMESLKDDGDTGTDLVVCPASLVYNWQEEIKRFAPKLRSSVISGTAAERKKELGKISGKKSKDTPDICITSYDSLRKDIALYEKIKFNVLILDEAQYIKNQKAGMTKAVKVLNGNHRFAMTGTPIENRLAELWSIFDFLMPGFLYAYKDFASRYETPIAKGKDQVAAESLKSMVRPFILRRLKSEVLKDLPEKLEEVRYVRFEEEQQKVYDGQVVKLKKIIESSSGNNDDKIRILAELTKLRQICCDPSLLFENYDGESAKRKGCLDLINSAISGGHRMLVFSQFTSMLELLEKDLNENEIKYYKITGATPKEQRIRMVHEFNDGDVPVFLISLKAGGTGLNLTGADVVIHYDPWWNLAAQNQATDRAHRIGQTNKVTVYKMIMKDTIEEKILGLQEAKKDLADAILEGESKSLFALSGEELMRLLD